MDMPLWCGNASFYPSPGQYRAHPLFPGAGDQKEDLQARLMDGASMSTHQTTDLNLAAFLLAQGHPLAEVQGTGLRRVFHFPKAAATDAKRFYQGATVPA